MDRLDQYREAIERLLSEIRDIPYAHGQIERFAIFDRKRDHYLLVCSGWEKYRVYGTTIHIQIRDGKVWLLEDNTDLEIALELERSGIPKSDIVLGFHPPEVRPHTGYAVA